jgi:hypothetical protein
MARPLSMRKAKSRKSRAISAFDRFARVGEAAPKGVADALVAKLRLSTPTLLVTSAPGMGAQAVIMHRAKAEIRRMAWQLNH